MRMFGLCRNKCPIHECVGKSWMRPSYVPSCAGILIGNDSVRLKVNIPSRELPPTSIKPETPVERNNYQTLPEMLPAFRRRRSAYARLLTFPAKSSAGMWDTTTTGDPH